MLPESLFSFLHIPQNSPLIFSGLPVGSGYWWLFFTLAAIALLLMVLEEDFIATTIVLLVAWCGSQVVFGVPVLQFVWHNLPFCGLLFSLSIALGYVYALLIYYLFLVKKRAFLLESQSYNLRMHVEKVAERHYLQKDYDSKFERQLAINSFVDRRVKNPQPEDLESVNAKIAKKMPGYDDFKHRVPFLIFYWFFHFLVKGVFSLLSEFGERVKSLSRSLFQMVSVKP